MISTLIIFPIDVMKLKHKEVNLMTFETNNIIVYDIVIKSMHPFFEVRKMSIIPFIIYFFSKY